MSSTLIASKGYANALITHTAAGLGTVSTPDLDCKPYRGIILAIDVTAITGTSPTLTVTIQGKDEISGKYYTILAGTALNATGTTILRAFPGATAAANSAANDNLPNTYRITTVIGGTGPAVTATISAVLV